MFWDDIPNAINVFLELEEQVRVLNDAWYAKLLQECRFGILSDARHEKH